MEVFLPLKRHTTAPPQAPLADFLLPHQAAPKARAEREKQGTCPKAPARARTARRRWTMRGARIGRRLRMAFLGGFSDAALSAGQFRSVRAGGEEAARQGICFLYLDTRFCLSIQQKPRSSRQCCEGCYQIRRNLWITFDFRVRADARAACRLREGTRMGLVSGACSVDGRKSCLWLVRGKRQMRGGVDLPVKSANRPQRPSMLRSALSKQEKSVDNF